MKPGLKRMVKNLTFSEWMAKPDAFATREQIVAFHNLTLMDQIVPLIRSAIQRYDAEQRAARWYRRLGLWVARLFGWRMTPEQAADIIQNYPREPEGQPEPGVGARAPGDYIPIPRDAEDQPEPEVVGAIRGGHPSGNGDVRQSCVTCGSRQLEPVNQHGGLRCHNGHVLEDPPASSCVTCGSRQLEPVNQHGGLRCHNGHVLEDPPASVEGDSGAGPEGSPGGPTQ